MYKIVSVSNNYILKFTLKSEVNMHGGVSLRRRYNMQTELHKEKDFFWLYQRGVGASLSAGVGPCQVLSASVGCKHEQ